MAAVSGAVSVSDPDTGQTVTLSVATAPAHGAASVAQDGSFTYTPSGTYTGHDTFTIEGCDDAAPPACDSGTVTVAIHPVAVDDVATVTTDGATIRVDVQANDIGDAGDVTIVSGPAHGAATVGSIVYTPDAGYSGADQVVYRVCSPRDPALCDDGTLSITVTGGAPETDTGSPLGSVVGRLQTGAVPPVVVVLLTIVAILGGGAVTKRRRSPDL
jgi:VCBS repeat-containing protein